MITHTQIILEYSNHGKIKFDKITRKCLLTICTLINNIYKISENDIINYFFKFLLLIQYNEMVCILF